MLGYIDLSIIFGYFILLTVVGVYFTKKASGSIDHFFLAGRQIPWYILGVAGMATYVDMSGTMLQVSFFYMLGATGFWVAVRGHVALSLAFQMIFMGKWLNRSKVMTNAEWVEFRFGKDKQGQIARFFSAASMMIMGMFFVAYVFIGSGKFFSLYLPFPPAVCALIFFGVMMIYTIASGFYGVVYNDLIQSAFIIGIIIYVTIKSIAIGTPEYYAQFASSEWRNFIPHWTVNMPPGYENMKFFGWLIIFWFISQIFQGYATPIDAWTSQKFYAAKNDRESSLIACQWIAMLSLRFLFMMGIAILGIGIIGGVADPEQVLPAVINNYLPVVAKGFFITALIAAAMSSLDAVVNSSVSYFINDVYRLSINPNASNQKLVRVSQITTFIFVVIGIIIGWTVPTINSIWAWIVMGFVTGMLPPNILKWFWWRFNGMGYALGMASGVTASIVVWFFFMNAPEYSTFMFVLLVSTIGTILGVYLGKDTDMDILVNFYKKTKPFGFWEPVRKVCDPEFVREVKKETTRDILLLIPTIIWQIGFFIMMTALVLRKWGSTLAWLGVVIAMSLVLYQYWYKNLKAE
jgi:solute:Na+ symporter, SSS family